MTTRTKNDEVTIIKKYANRRLYDTGRSSYVTLDDLREMIQDNIDFVVIDAKSGNDITRTVLSQIIAENESDDEDNLMSLDFMKDLIKFYGDTVQTAVPQYLEQTFKLFVENQEVLREQMSKSFESMNPMNTMQSMNPMNTMNPMNGLFGQSQPDVKKTLEDMNKQNMEMFERTMKMFSSFGQSPQQKD